ncbi:MAG TPA: hypothetical protein VND93_06720 [Myxococcales bacterium]|nr:hypothetical protein [Myxococcales bacterium]
MTAPNDALLDADSRDRLYYAMGVLLDATDFGAEQSYHRGRLARALAYLHGFGTAAGLKAGYKPPTPTPDAEEITVDAGLAVDQFGRLVEVPNDACLKLDRWYWQDGLGLDDFGVFNAADFHLTPGTGGAPATGVVADLFVRFRPCQRGKTPAFAVGPFDATDAVVQARTRDEYELRLVPRDAGHPPPVVPASNSFPDDSEADLAVRRAALRTAIFGAWRGDRATELAALWNSTFIPQSLLIDPDQVDHHVRDPAWVFLARVVIGTQAGTDTRGTLQRPKRSGAVYVDNDSRPFSLTAAALARWLGAV